MIGLLWTMLAWAGPFPNVEGCLARQDLPCAFEALEKWGPREEAGGVRRALWAEVHFYAGLYPEAFDDAVAAIDMGVEGLERRRDLYERTLYATAGWVERRRGRFIVRYRPGPDALLVEDAFDALERAEEHLAPKLGGPPPGQTILEIYPDIERFTAASSLMKEDVDTTGVVALSKWSRLLVASPRAMYQGYDWQDTIAHEYIHLVVSHHSEDRSPVWLQEAIAKALDAQWEDGQDRFALDVRSSSYLAEALRRDQFVPFEEMHPSLAKLPTAERAALAYAQLATLMRHAMDRGGEGVLREVLPRVANREDPGQALAEVSGATDMEDLWASWKVALGEMDLDEREVEELPRVFGGETDVAQTDPTMARRLDLARFLRLGDLLAKRGEHEAALIEYSKAQEAELPSPLLANRVAQAYLAIGAREKAEQVLAPSLEEYPEYTLTHRTLAELATRRGDHAQAVAWLESALALDPFDVDIRQRLVKALPQAGRATEVEGHIDALALLRQGGEEDPGQVLHDRVGVVVVPQYAEGEAPSVDPDSQWVGEVAPDVSGVSLEGQELGSWAGQVRVLDFWATWCGPCVASMPRLEALHEQHAAQGLVVLGLTDERPEVVRAFLARRNVSYLIGVDEASSTHTRYRVDGLPTAFVIGRDGRVVGVVKGGGEQSHLKLEQLVLKALASE